MYTQLMDLTYHKFINLNLIAYWDIGDDPEGYHLL